MKYSSLSDIGKVRSHNEDAYLVQPPLFAVADGLGGHQAGEVASQMALDKVVEILSPLPQDEKTLQERLIRALRETNQEIYKKSEENIEYQGMGTTLTLACLFRSKLFIAHVGDSRAYLFRERELYRLTEDHSLVHQMVKEGRLKEEEAELHPLRSTLTQAIGISPQVQVDLTALNIKVNDWLLLTTDGLTVMLKDSEIKEVLTKQQKIEVCVQELVKRANERGGFDNITVVIVSFDKEDVTSQ
jgi:protein phosphatase